MKKRILSFVIMTAVLVASFSAFTAFAATETLDLSASALRTLNGADDLDDEEAQSGATWSQVGFWRDQTGGDTDCLMPFAEEWPAVPALGDTHIVFMNYEGYILIAKDIDLSKYSKATISYSTDGSFTQAENEIGLFSKNASFGKLDERKTDGLLASGFTTPANGEPWDTPRTMEIDLTDVDYKGDLYLAYYMKEANGVCVTGIEFTLAEEGSQGGDTTGDNDNQGGQTGNTETGEMSFALIVAAAAAVITVLFRKKSAV